jgi:RNA recognition motif-containing protein
MSTAVDNLADNLAATSINDPVAATSAADAAAVSAEEGRRLYIGNLAYATTDGELREFFKSYTM